jgi:hypothetical protein
MGAGACYPGPSTAATIAAASLVSAVASKCCLSLVDVQANVPDQIGSSDSTIAASCFAARCDQIPTLNENQLGSYSEHSCAYWHPHGSAKLSAKEKKGVSHERQHPPGASTKVRTALGRQISSTGSHRAPTSTRWEGSGAAAPQSRGVSAPGYLSKGEKRGQSRTNCQGFAGVVPAPALPLGT